MRKLSKNIHLTKSEIIKNGSIFTPDYIVDLVFSLIIPHINNDSIIGDFCSGYGAFLDKFNELPNTCFGTEMDDKSYEFLKENFNNIVYHENSLININRKKYNIKDNDELIIVGNPPYNDITSQYKKGKKGEILCDDDVKSRDMGTSFLKAYSKLNAKYICVLHPLAYLIKKQNFNMLKDFKDNYKLLKAIIFSSKEFESIKKSNSDFPVVAALYERDNDGMTYEDIYNFKFNILDSNKVFCLNNIKTIDGIISKYPKKEEKSKIQFYTQRDMNSLLRNTSFISSSKTNGINVNIDNLYQYCWLFFLKNNFNPKNMKFLYGNLSPLYFSELESDNYKNMVVSYAYNNCSLLSDSFKKEDIEFKYGRIVDNYEELYNKLNELYLFE